MSELSAKMSRAAVEFERSASPALRKAAGEAKRLSDPFYQAAAGADFKLSHWRPGPTFRTGYEFMGDESFKLSPRHPGVDVGFGAHLIGAGRSRSGRRTLSMAQQVSRGGNVKGRRNTGFLKGAGYGHPVRGPVLHPGVKEGGYGSPFRRAVVPISRRIPDVYARARFDAMANGFR
jgi:hypothetical protein